MFMPVHYNHILSTHTGNLHMMMEAVNRPRKNNNAPPTPNTTSHISADMGSRMVVKLEGRRVIASTCFL